MFRLPLKKTVNSTNQDCWLKLRLVRAFLPQRDIRYVSCNQNATKISSKDVKHAEKEVQAIFRMFNRSNLLSVNWILPSKATRSFHTSSSFSYKPPPFGPPSKSDPSKKDSEKDPNKKKKDDTDANYSSLLAKALLWTLAAYVTVTMISVLFQTPNHPEILRYVSWNEFYHQMLAKGEVEEIIVRPDLEVVTIILHEGAVVKGKQADQRIYHMNIGDIHRFEDKLREAEKSLGVKEVSGVPVIYERGGEVAGKVLLTLIFFAFIVSILSRTKGMKLNVDSFTQMGRAKFTLVDPLSGPGKGVKFSDVAGLKEAKIEVMEFVDYLKRPERYKTLGAKVPKGALLLGPPGCGKTLLAKAVATEANVPFLSMNGSEFIEMIGGLGAARVRDLFKEANKRSPCIIYIDEIDAIGRQRSGTSANSNMGSPGGGEREQTLNQLLVEMDGMASKEGVVILASTNRADVLDKALLRPGRFDRHILIDLPTMTERREIFERHLKVIVLENPPTYYSNRLSYLTPGFSGADIANVCNEAALHAARTKKSQVTGQDLEYAVERLVGGTEKRNHAMSPQEKRVVAYHESGHALVGWLLEHTDALLKVTIVPRTSLALGFAQYTPTDQKLYNKEQLFDRMCMALGGRAAESIVFNRITTGAQNDLDKVTKMAYAQVREYGMSDVVGLLSFPEQSKESGKAPYSKSLKNLIDVESRKLIAKSYFHTESVLKANRDKLELLAETLLDKETLNYEDVVKLIGLPPHKNKKLIEPMEFEIFLKGAGTSEQDSNNNGLQENTTKDNGQQNENLKFTLPFVNFTI